MYKILNSKFAQIDMLSVFYYISYNLKNNIAAVAFMEDIGRKINSLEYLPYRGAIYNNYFNRFVIQKNFLIFYEIQEKEKLIVIKRIIHKNINSSNYFIDVY